VASASFLNPVRLSLTQRLALVRSIWVAAIWQERWLLASPHQNDHSIHSAARSFLHRGSARWDAISLSTGRPRGRARSFLHPLRRLPRGAPTCPFRSLYRSDRRGMGGWVTSCLPHVLSDLFPLQHLRGYAQLRMGTAARSEARSYLRAEVAKLLVLRLDGSHLSTGRRENHPRRCSERSHSRLRSSQRESSWAHPVFRKFNRQYENTYIDTAFFNNYSIFLNTLHSTQVHIHKSSRFVCFVHASQVAQNN
jgi:hypothetical protein